jgi:hypothetical protein
MLSGSTLREFVGADEVGVDGNVLRCPTCGGSYGLDVAPGLTLSIEAARAKVLQMVLSDHKAEWLIAFLAGIAAIAVGLLLATLVDSW